MVDVNRLLKINKLSGKILKLANFMDYQAGAIVSREIINKKTGTVTVFAFDREQGLSQHTAPYDAMVTILDGVAKIYISGKSFTVKSGETIIMPANKPHSLKAVKRFKMMLTMIRS